MGPWSFVAPRFEKQLACKVSTDSANTVIDIIVDITPTRLSSLSFS